MRHISNWRGLEEFGISLLTGEACGCGMRLLCDLNEDGMRLLQAFFGGNVQFARQSNWNTTVNDQPAVASVLLPHSIFNDLAAFCLLSTGSHSVWLGMKWLDSNTERGPVLSHDVIGLTVDETMPKEYYSDGKLMIEPVTRTYMKWGTAELRNKHEMTGRTT